MPDQSLEDAVPERASIGFIVAYLKTRPNENVKDLIGRRIATGVFRGDTDEVVYWAAVHHAYRGKPLEHNLRQEVLACLCDPAANNA